MPVACHQLTVASMEGILQSPEQEVSEQTRECNMQIQIAVFTALVLLIFDSEAIAQTNAPDTQVRANVGLVSQILSCQEEDGQSKCVNPDTGEVLINPMPKWVDTSVAMEIPGYQEGDIDRYYYMVNSIRESGGGRSGSAVPDDDGIIHRPDKVQIRVDGRQEPVQYYLVAADRVSGEMWVTADLYEVNLMGLATTLEMSVQSVYHMINALDIRESLQLRQFSGRAGRFEYRNMLLTLNVKWLPLDDFLDEIYQVTGCRVEQESIGIYIRTCS
jgi:hypothetical protein